MKKLLTAIAIAAFLIYPSVCFASYVIHLKDGREFATEQYFEEGDQIKFKRYGGIIGIRKDLVREIEVREQVEELPEEKESPAKPEAPETAKKEGAGEQQVNEKDEKIADGNRMKKEGDAKRSVEKEGDKKSPGIDIAHYQKQKKELMARYEEAKKKLNDAVQRNDKRAKWEAKTEIKKIHATLAELIRELKLASGGTLPDWWHEPANPEKPDT